MRSRTAKDGKVSKADPRSPACCPPVPVFQMVLAVASIVIVGIWAYQTSFQGALLFDDGPLISDNRRIRTLWPITPLLSATTRPVVEVSLALNYALSGKQLWSYHAVNLALHVLVALLFFGLVRRTLEFSRYRPGVGEASWGAALSCALVWVAHPLNTQSVTYMIQRAEVLMGLCYLLTLYALARGHSAAAPQGWYAIGVLSCALGMGSKPIMVTAPLMALLYDRIFLAGSVRQALRRL